MKLNKFGLIIFEGNIIYKLLILILNIFLTPILLIYYSFIIYLFPCIQFTLISCLCHFCSLNLFYKCFFKYILYKDKEFLPNYDSLGEIKTNKKINWKRASEISVKNKKLNKLFDSGISIDDICQGQLGDCWLLSAIASLSSQPITLTNAFITKEFNPRGKYKFKIWDPIKQEFIRIIIDDYIPIDESTNEPIFTRPNGNEIWVMLIEKVFAKFMGNYASIEAGHPIFAMHILTGQKVSKFVFRNNKWDKTNMKVTKDNKTFKISFFLDNDGEPLDGDKMYELIAKYSKEGRIMSASSSGRDNTIEEGRGTKGGIVPGHAYTILQVYSPLLTLKSGIRLVKLRNPWYSYNYYIFIQIITFDNIKLIYYNNFNRGAFEWNGDWSDKSDLWKQHPQIKFEMGFNPPSILLLLLLLIFILIKLMNFILIFHLLLINTLL